MSEKLDHHLGEDLAAMAEGGASLPEAKKLELERHIEGCAACKTAIASAKLVLDAVDAVRPPDPSTSFDHALFARLDAIDRRAASPGFWERVRELFTLPKLGAAVAAVAVLVLGLVFYDPDIDQVAPEKLLTRDVAENLDGLAFAEDLEVLQELDVVEDLDVLEDLEVIEMIDGEAG
jgi:hypothetical protein